MLVNRTRELYSRLQYCCTFVLLQFNQITAAVCGRLGSLLIITLVCAICHSGFLRLLESLGLFLENSIT